MRLIFVCAIAVMLLSVERKASSASICCQSRARSEAPFTRRRIAIANAAIFGAAPTMSVTAVGAVVDIRDPHVERHHADLEGEAGDQEHEAENQERAVGGARRKAPGVAGHLVEAERAGCAVDHRHAVEKRPEESAPSTKYFITSR